MGQCTFNFVFYAINAALIAYCHANTLFEYFLAWPSLHLFPFLGNGLVKCKLGRRIYHVQL